MHCHICDAILTEKEIKIDKRTGKYEPCSVCIEASLVDCPPDVMEYTVESEFDEGD